jgi:hypothetical protein
VRLLHLGAFTEACCEFGPIQFRRFASDQHAFGANSSAADQAEVQRLCCAAVAAMFGHEAVALVASCSGMKRREVMPSRSHRIDWVEHPLSEALAAADNFGPCDLEC